MATPAGPGAPAPPAPLAPPAQSTPLAVRKLTLFSHGLASLHLSATVAGDATLRLAFAERHMNDVLKSLTAVDDSPHGHIAAVSYDAPPDDRHPPPGALTVDPAAPLRSLLEAAQGAAVTLARSGALSHAGTLLGLQWLPVPPAQPYPPPCGPHPPSPDNPYPPPQPSYVPQPPQPSPPQPPQAPHQTLHVTLLSHDNATLTTHQVTDLASVHFDDPHLHRLLARRVEAALAALRPRTKSVSIVAKAPTGSPPREVAVNYAVEAPVPKLTYRFLLPPPGETGPVSVQGWAIVDNPSEHDLVDVDVTIVSGLPISFTHDLYAARYVDRPEEEVPTAAGPGYSKPSTATFGWHMPRKNLRTNAARLAPIPQACKKRHRRVLAVKSARLPGADDMDIEEDSDEGGSGSDELPNREMGPPPAETTEIGDLFEYNLPNKVTINARESALVPLIAADCEGSRVGIYSHKVRPGNTLSAVRVRNTTDATFESGPVSVYDRARLVGEGMLAACRPHSEQFLPYSIDLGCTVELDEDQVDGDVVSTYAVGQYLRVTRYREAVKKYVFRSQKPDEIDLYVLHEKVIGFDLQSASLQILSGTREVEGGNGNGMSGVEIKTVEVRGQVARYRFSIPAGSTAKLTVRERKQEVRRHSIRSRCTEERILELRLGCVINEKTEAMMKEVAQLLADGQKVEREVEEHERKVEDLESEQERFRANLKSLAGLQESKKFRDDPLVEKFLKSLAESEERIQGAKRQIVVGREQMRRLKAEVDRKVLVFGDEELQ